MISLEAKHVREKSRLRASLFLFFAALMATVPAGATTASLCVQVEKDGLPWRSIPARPGGEARLSFQHSIYGSRVEEVFRLAPDAFHLTALRYAEPRLVEFYGYDGAVYENGAWVVRPRSSKTSSLGLRTSSAAPMLLAVEQEQRFIHLAMPADSVLRLTIASCKDAQNG
jgi:hypothetical protein